MASRNPVEDTFPHPTRWIPLGPTDAPRIVDLERRCFIPPLQAKEATICQRFDLGHSMLGVTDQERLIAMIGFCLVEIDPIDKRCYPPTETAFCLQPSSDDPNCLVVYNLEVDPAHRRHALPLYLLEEAMQHAKTLGIRHSIGNARVPTFAGSGSALTQEHFPLLPAVREAVERLLRDERPTDHEGLLLDPVLNLYHRLTGCDFILALPNYAPDDTASGGHRVIVYRDLQKWAPRQ
jgi:GNAT superfamily N-acetyltransferase